MLPSDQTKASSVPKQEPGIVCHLSQQQRAAHNVTCDSFSPKLSHPSRIWPLTQPPATGNSGDKGASAKTPQGNHETNPGTES